MKKIILPFLILSLFSCKKQTQNNYSAKTIILEAEYINFAWGYQHSSIIIDSNGFIHKYGNTNPDNHDWKPTDNLGYISEVDLQNNLNLCSVLVNTLNLDTIRQCISLIPQVTTNDLTSKENVGADGGSTLFYCYVWNADKQKYKRQFLAECGDNRQLNNDASAQSILHLIWNSSNAEFIWHGCF